MPADAVMIVDALFTSFELAVAVNVADVAPAGITTTSGTVATVGTEEVKPTENPPVGAGNEMETVPVDDPPTAIADGFTVKVVNFGA